MYDVIGDIHGQAGKLEALLSHLGYVPQGRGFRPPAGRQAVFLGDLIDRGPEQVRVIEIVRVMVEAGWARCIAGNHELNAIAFVTPDPAQPDECLRPNRLPTPKGLKNREQHAAFLEQVVAGSALHRSMVAWFKTLPPFLDLGGVRVVHACWSDAWVQTVTEVGWVEGKGLSEALLPQLYVPGTALNAARRGLTTGVELPLPPGRYIEDKSGHRHGDVRIASWREGTRSLKDLALVPAGQEAQLEGMTVPPELELTPVRGAPVMLGHHWFKGPPRIESPKVAVLDWSAGTDGHLVAYRWDGESALSDDKMVWVG